MSTPAELAARALRKIKVIGVGETADADDLQIAVQGVTDAHNILANQGLLRWTLDSIPQECDLGYVLMAAYLISDDFVKPKDPGMMAQGASNIQAFVYLPSNEPTYSVDF